MTEPKFPSGLGAISAGYDAILCDVWGVIHNGRKAFDAACEALVKFRQAGGAVILITNAPVPKAQVLRYFEPLGVPGEAFDDCVSSGDATRNELRKKSDRAFWLLGVDEGWPQDRFLYDGLNLNFTDFEVAETILCMGLEDQANDHPEDYRARLAEAASRGLDMICANPDIKVRVGNNLVWCGGALAQVFESEGGAVIYPGKPYRAIYYLAVDRLKGMGVASAATRILCIGDSPATDLTGAQNMGFDSLYVGTGLQEHKSDFEAEVAALLTSYDVAATWAMPRLRW
ncbi:MAG: TIGR01459 family HAD-type hydrolase [Pseudomonadota bacterium]